MGQFGIGQAVKRFEDVRLLRGEGRFHDDVTSPARPTPSSCARRTPTRGSASIDTRAALRAPGVLAVFTGDDLARGRPRHDADDARSASGPTARRCSRRRTAASPQDRVRYVGDPVALVVAETLAQAEDAAELVRGRLRAAAVGDRRRPRRPSPAAPRSGTSAPTTSPTSSRPATRPRPTPPSRGPHHVVRRRYVITRVHAQYMEPRGALGVYDPGEDRYTLYADVQYPHRVRNALASNIFQVPEHQIRVIAGDVGGAFGTKGWQYPEHRLVLWAARKLGRPVKWACERREAILADEHARDNVSEAELALDADGRFLALRVRTARQRRRLRLLGPQPARDLQQRRHARRRLRDPGRARPRHRAC